MSPPIAPDDLQVDLSKTDETSIYVIMSTLTQDGGSPIVSYSLEWDTGLGTSVFTSLVGANDNNIVLTY